jgi:transcriptional regulator with XRE-family HTH domain
MLEPGPAAVALAAFIGAAGITQREAAEALGVSGAAVTQYIKGRSRPGLPVRMRIAKWTRNKIPVALWGDDVERDLGAVVPWTRQARPRTKGAA